MKVSKGRKVKNPEKGELVNFAEFFGGGSFFVFNFFFGLRLVLTAG